VVAYIRTVKTASEAVAVQIVHANRRGSREIEHIGSADTPDEVEVLRAAARQRLHANQDIFDFGDGQPRVRRCQSPRRSPSICGRIGLAYDKLGFDTACKPDEVFRALALARVVEPTSLAEVRDITATVFGARVELSADGGAAEVQLVQEQPGLAEPVLILGQRDGECGELLAECHRHCVCNWARPSLTASTNSRALSLSAIAEKG
jgi:hypothetical protein